MKAVWGFALLLLPSVGFGDEIKPIAIGSKVADFKLRDYRGRERSLGEFLNGKAVVIAFVGTECPVAKLYATRLVEMAKQYEPKGVAFLAVNSNQQDSISDLTRFAQEHKISFPILKDVKNAVADQF